MKNRELDKQYYTSTTCPSRKMLAVNRSKLSSAVISLVALVGVSPEAFSATLALDEIVVTAERREASLQDIPVTLSAFSAEQLEAFGIRNAEELPIITPGLVMTKSGSSLSYFLRGIGARTAAPGFEPSISIYVDERYIPRQDVMAVDLADIERVEVLKGPQGTFFGRNATGGAVRFITRNPTDDTEGYIKASLGNYDYTQVSGVFNTPISDSAAIRLVAQKSDRDGFADNLYDAPGVPDTVDDLDTLTLRGKLDWDITEKVNLLLSTNYMERDDTNGQDLRIVSPPGYALALPPFTPGAITGNKAGKVALNGVGDQEVEELSTDAVLTFNFDGFDLVSSTSYTDAESFAPIDIDGTQLAVLAGESPRSWDMLTQEFRIQSNSDSDLQWLAGLYYYDEDTDTETVINKIVSLGFMNSKVESYAVFGQIEWNFSSNWNLILGGRWTTEDKEVVLLNSTIPGVLVNATPGAPYSADESWNEFTPRATLQYDFGDQMVYATYSEGFKSGGFNYPLLTAGVPQPVVDPEYLKMYELGAKGKFAEGRLVYDAAVYYYDYSDLQVPRSQGDGQVLTENAADAEVYGLDLNVQFLATENWMLSANINLLDNEYTDYMAVARAYAPLPVPVIGPVVIDASGHNLLGASDYAFTLSSRYEIPMAQGVVPVVLSYSYKDDYYFDFVEDPLTAPNLQDGYGLLSGRISYEPSSGQWSMGVWGKNLTDEEYFDAAGAGTISHNGLDGAPRTYGVDMSFNF